MGHQEKYFFLISSLDSYFLEIFEPSVRCDKWFPIFTPNSYVVV